MESSPQNVKTDFTYCKTSNCHHHPPDCMASANIGIWHRWAQRNRAQDHSNLHICHPDVDSRGSTSLDYINGSGSIVALHFFRQQPLDIRQPSRGSARQGN